MAFYAPPVGLQQDIRAYFRIFFGYAVSLKGIRQVTGAFSSASPIAAVFFLGEGESADLFLENSANKGILISSDLVPVKTTRSSQGVTLFTMKDGLRITRALIGENAARPAFSKCRKNKIPATGIAVPEQIALE